MAGSDTGDAIFSTDLGRWPPRDPTIMPPRIILRSDPTEDMEAKIAELQAKYPSHCKAMKAPITNINDYFDTYDQQLHGQMFLHTVLMEICLHNTLRKNAVLEYSETWIRLNPVAFEYVHQFELNAFTNDDLEEYGEDFLWDVLELLQLQRTKQNEPAFLAPDTVPMPNQDQFQEANARPFAVFPPQDHEFGRPTQRNFSAPTSSHISFAQPQVAPSLPPSTPGLEQLFMQNPPIPRPLQRMEFTNTRPIEPPFPSAPLHPSRRAEHYSDPTDSGIAIPRPGFSDTIVALPPPGSVPGPFSFHRVPAGPREFHYPASKSRTLPRSRGPIHVGLSNDARVLERQGVSQNRGLFGEGRGSRNFAQPYAQAGSYSRAYAPFQPDQTYGISAQRPPQVAKRPFPGSRNNADRGMPLEGNRPPKFTDQDSFNINQRASMSSNFDGVNALSKRDHAIQQYPFAKSAHHQDTFHKTHHTERDVFLDSTPPNRSQRQTKTSQADSPTAHRFSNASLRPSETTPRARDTGGHQYGPDSHNYKSDKDLPVSDRKVWIGGLLPDTDVVTLSHLFEPWGPVSLSKTYVPKGVKGRSYPPHVGFAFAEFDTPQRAADAIKALNEQYLDIVQHKISLKPAYIRPEFDEDDGSPKKPDSRMNYHPKYQGSFGGDKQGQMRADLMSFEAGTQAASLLSVEQPGQPGQKRDQFSAEWPALGMSTPCPGQVPNFPKDVQPHIFQDTHKEGTLAHLSGPGDIDSSKDLKLASARDEGATRVSSSSTKAPYDGVPSHKSKTPSPRKKNNRNATKNGSTSGTTAQAKQRKEMLSNLRTEKLNVATSDSVSHMPIVGNPPHHNQVNSVISRKNSSESDKTIIEDPPISAPTLGNNVEIAATVRSESSGEQVSPVHSTSTHDRRLSSASVVLSTDPTSYAHSESSITSTMTFQPSCCQIHGESPRSSRTAEDGSVDVLELHHTLGDIAATMLPEKNEMGDAPDHVMVQPSKGKSPPDTSVHEADMASTEFSPPAEKIARTDEQDNSLASPSIQLSASDKAETIASNASEIDSETLGLRAKDGTADDVAQPRPPNEMFNEVSALSNSRIDDHTAASKHATLKSSTQPGPNQPSSAQAQQAICPPSKRGLLKDPKVLIAVPKIPLLMRLKPQSREIPVQDPRMTTHSEGQPDLPSGDKDVDVDKTSGRDETRSSPNAASNFSAATEKEQLLESTGIPKPEEGPVVAVGKEQPSEMNSGNNRDDRPSRITAMSEMLATIEDDRLDPDTSTPQSFAAAMRDLAAKNIPEKSSPEQQPTAQQKKSKSKKGKKKAKKAKTSQADSAEGSKSSPEPSAVHKEQATNRLQVETPFLSDDKQPLPRPTFAIQNHSSMRSRCGKTTEIQSIFETSDERSGQALESHSLHSSRAPTLKNNNEQNYILLLVNPSKDIGEQDSSSAQAELQTSGNVQTQTAGPETHEEGVQSEGQEPSNVGDKVDEAALEARAKNLDEYLKENNKPTRHQLLATIEWLSLPQQIDRPEESLVPPKEGSNSLQGMDGPRVEEITSVDEAQPVSTPTAPMEQHKERVVPSRDASLDKATTEDPSQMTEERQKIDEARLGGGISVTLNRVTASSPCTRRTSPERSRFRSLSPAKGLGISIRRLSSNNNENISPTRQARKNLSYKQVASTPSFQPGEIVEITPKESYQEGKEGQGITMVRKAGNKDPWRVPSSEQPWGGNNKAKGGPSTEASGGR